MLNPLNPRRDLRLSGHVIYTGRSSMEIAVKMESVASAEESADETVLIGPLPSHFFFALLIYPCTPTGRFSMVCRDARTNRAREVHPLVATTLEEKRLFALGERMFSFILKYFTAKIPNRHEKSPPHYRLQISRQSPSNLCRGSRPARVLVKVWRSRRHRIRSSTSVRERFGRWRSQSCLDGRYGA